MPSSWPVGFLFEAYLSRSYNNPIYSQGASASLVRCWLTRAFSNRPASGEYIYIYKYIYIYYGFWERSRDVDSVRGETNLCAFVFAGWEKGFR